MSSPIRLPDDEGRYHCIVQMPDGPKEMWEIRFTQGRPEEQWPNNRGGDIGQHSRHLAARRARRREKSLLRGLFADEDWPAKSTSVLTPHKKGHSMPRLFADEEEVLL